MHFFHILLHEHWNHCILRFSKRECRFVASILVVMAMWCNYADQNALEKKTVADNCFRHLLMDCHTGNGMFIDCCKFALIMSSGYWLFKRKYQQVQSEVKMAEHHQPHQHHQHHHHQHDSYWDYSVCNCLISWCNFSVVN